MTPNPPLFRIGRSVIDPVPSEQQIGAGQIDEPERPVNLVLHESGENEGEGEREGGRGDGQGV